MIKERMPVVRNHYYLWTGLFLAILWPVWTFLGKLCRFRYSSLWWNQENILIFTLTWVYHSCNMCLQLFPLNQYLPENKIDSREAPKASSSLWRHRYPLSKHMSHWFLLTTERGMQRVGFATTHPCTRDSGKRKTLLNILNHPTKKKSLLILDF